ncbi:MAG: hypothetical protein V2A54_08465 [Bacteroidota bacterium]
MKFYKSILLISFLLPLAFSCKVTDETRVREVSDNFLKCINHKDYDGAKKFSTKESEAALDMMKAFASLNSEDVTKEYLITSIEINGTTAICKYMQNNEEKLIELKRIEGKWFVDMKKETPPPPPPPPTDEERRMQMIQDSIAAAEAAIEEARNDTITFLDFSLTDAVASGTSSVLTFELNNKYNYVLEHLWMEVYISNRDGKFIQKKDLMFDKLDRHLESMGDFEAPVTNTKSKVKLTIEKCLPADIGEVFLSVKRFEMEKSFFEDFYYEGGMFEYVKRYTKITNYTPLKVEIVF